MWTAWTDLLASAMQGLAASFGLSEAAAIVVLTLLARIALSPLSLAAAYQAQQGRLALARLKPSLDRLQERYKDDPGQRAARTLALYREHDVRFFGRLGLFNAGAQTVFGLGLFQALHKLAFESRFLWIANLAKPDFLLALLAGTFMYVGMMLLPETANTPMLILVPVAVSVLTLAFAPSALGVYWATSNAFSVLHAFALRGLLRRPTPAPRKRRPRC